MRRRILLRGLSAATLGGTCSVRSLRAQGAALVLGQTLPLSGPGFPAANRVLAGARAMVARLAAGGGLNGRPVELVALDDAGDPRRSAGNVRTLAERHGAIAVLCSLGEAASLASAHAARDLGVPLVAPMSGALALREAGLPTAYTLQPDDRHEAQSLLRQLRIIGITRVVHLADGHEPERQRVLTEVLQAGGVALRLTPVTTPSALPGALREALAPATSAMLLSLGLETIDALGRLPPAAMENLPPMVLSMSGPGLTQQLRLMRSRVFGFTSVLPNPEASRLPLVREFERDVDALGSPEALSYEGLAGYLSVRVCAEALVRARGRLNAAGLASAIESMGRLHIGGFSLHFTPGRRQGSDHVEIGIRGRDGRARQ